MKQDPRTTKALKLLDEAVELNARAADKILEAKIALASEPSTQSQVKRLFDYWAGLYMKRYGIAYVFAGPKEGTFFKRLLKQMPAEELARRLKAYINDTDDWVTDKKHSLGIFFGTVVRYGQVIDAGGQPDLELSAPVGCGHTPPCKSDVAHTKRIMRELRGEQ